MLTFGSLFSGIGGLDLGFERAGFRCVFQIEIDDLCNSVLEWHWPDIRRFRDIRSISPDWLCDADIFVGGFPCQGISQAGAREGLADERSRLWYEYRRLIEACRPRFVVIENVQALLYRGGKEVLEGLAALGYDAEWDIVPAASVGAPHLRERFFAIAWNRARVRVPDALGDCLRQLGERSGEQRGEPRPTLAGDDGSIGPLADTHRDGCLPGGPATEGSARQARPESSSRGLAHTDGDGRRRRRRGAPAPQDGLEAPRRGALADGDRQRRQSLGGGGLLDGEPPLGDDADGRGGPALSDTDRDGLGARGSGDESRGTESHVDRLDRRGRVFHGDELAAFRTRCEEETWPRAEADVEPGLGDSVDGLPAGMARPRYPIEPWERGIARAVTVDRATRSRHKQQLRALGNAVVPQVAEYVALRLRDLVATSELV